MEHTRGNLQNSRNELKKSVGREDDGPHFHTTNHISSVHNRQINTLIEYDNDETLEIKKEIIPAQERYQSGHNNLLPEKNLLDEKPIFFHNNSGGRTFIVYDNDETLEIKEEIIQDQEIHQSRDHILLPDKNHPEEKSTFSDKISCDRTLIEYDNDETLEIKEEIIKDKKIHQIGDQNHLSEKNHPEEKFVFCDNNAGCRTLIEYDNDETLEIKEEVVQDRENAGKMYNKKYELKLCPVDVSADDIFDAKYLHCTPMKQKMQESKTDKKKKSKASQPRHKCANCCQSYITKGSLIKHERLQHAAVKPQFLCDVCGYKASTKQGLSRHVSARHFADLTGSQARHNCNKCSRSYGWLSDLKRHDRLRHAAVKPQFICDSCGHKTNLKSNLSKHISVRHFKNSTKSQARHNCDKCSRSYSWLSTLSTHYRLKHSAVKPQFTCDVCGYKANRKYYLLRHISVRHFKNASQARPNCNICSRSYSTRGALNRHKRLKHPKE